MLDLSNRLSANVAYFEKFVLPSSDIRYEMDYRVRDTGWHEGVEVELNEGGAGSYKIPTRRRFF